MGRAAGAGPMDPAADGAGPTGRAAAGADPMDWAAAGGPTGQAAGADPMGLVLGRGRPVLGHPWLPGF